MPFSKSDVMVNHYFDRNNYNNKGGYTLGFLINDPKMIMFTIAKCSKKDFYNRKIGRALVVDRLLNNDSKLVKIYTINDFVEDYKDKFEDYNSKDNLYYVNTFCLIRSNKLTNLFKDDVLSFNDINKTMLFDFLNLYV